MALSFTVSLAIKRFVRLSLSRINEELTSGFIVYFICVIGAVMIFTAEFRYYFSGTVHNQTSTVYMQLSLYLYAALYNASATRLMTSQLSNSSRSNYKLNLYGNCLVLQLSGWRIFLPCQLTIQTLDSKSTCKSMCAHNITLISLCALAIHSSPFHHL